MAAFQKPCPMCSCPAEHRGAATGHEDACPLAIKCPACLRDIGSWCTGPAGHRAMTLHKPRRDASGYTIEQARLARQDAHDGPPALF